MRILMTADTVGGVWTYAICLCRALNHSGIEVGLATMGAKMSEPQRMQAAQLSATRVFESEYKLCWMEDSDQDVEAAAEWLMGLRASFKPDLVHLNDLAHGELEWRVPVLMVVHSCVFTWWLATLDKYPDGTRWLQYKARIIRGVKSVDMLVAPTLAMLDSFQSVYGAARQARVIYNGRDWPRIPAKESCGLRLIENLPPSEQKLPSKPFIFAAGRIWDQAKNLEHLAAVSASLPWPVCIAGQDTDPQGTSAPLSNVTALGVLDETQMEPWLYRSEIYVAPAFYEPFGLAILEAARAGNALVLSDIASLREVWGDAATYIDPRDSESLKYALMALIHNPVLRRSKAARAQRRAARYTERAMAQGYEQTYRQMVALKPDNRPQTVSTNMGVRL